VIIPPFDECCHSIHPVNQKKMNFFNVQLLAASAIGACTQAWQGEPFEVQQITERSRSLSLHPASEGARAQQRKSSGKASVAGDRFELYDGIAPFARRMGLGSRILPNCQPICSVADPLGRDGLAQTRAGA